MPTVRPYSVRSLTGTSDIVRFVDNVGIELAASGVLVAVFWLRDTVRLRVLPAWRWCSSALTRKRYVLLWIDDERGHARKLIRRLEADMPSEPISFKTLKHPRSILSYPRSRRRVRAIILLNTDVTKLADEPQLARRIEDRLHRYVDDGGGLVGSHDLIYRRVRSEVLQNMFGCQITQFVSCETPVPYECQITDHPLAEGLTTPFTLLDGEICWGAWAPDVDIVFQTDATNGDHPLVVAREFSQGRVVWLNSGDKTEWLCASISRPEPPFALLLRNAVKWSGEAVV